MIASELHTLRLRLAVLDPNTISPAYCDWLNNPDVNRYLEVRFHRQTPESVSTFVSDINESSHSVLFGIFVRESARHIGNIKLGPIDSNHARADIGLLIGEQSEWGKGYAREAIEAVTEHAFGVLKLRKVTAGCYAGNEGSRRAFVQAGFREAARLSGHWWADDHWEDGIVLERFNALQSPNLVDFNRSY